MKMFSTIKKNSNFVFPKIMIIIAFILFNVFFLFSWFSNVATGRFVHVAELCINRYIENVTSNFKTYSLGKNSSDQFLEIRENMSGEIVSIDYKMEKIYDLAELFTKTLQQSIDNSSLFKNMPYKWDYDVVNDYGIVISIPLGIVSDSLFLNNLGPKIPVYVHFINSVFTQVKTRARDYGINNAILDVYLDITIHYEIVTPLGMEEKKIQYEFLLDSKVIQGKVPNLFGGRYETQSSFLEVTFP